MPTLNKGVLWYVIQVIFTRSWERFGFFLLLVAVMQSCSPMLVFSVCLYSLCHVSRHTMLAMVLIGLMRYVLLLYVTHAVLYSESFSVK